MDLKGNVMKVRTQVIHQQETLNYHGEQISYMQEDSNQRFYEEDDYILPERTPRRVRREHLIGGLEEENEEINNKELEFEKNFIKEIKKCQKD